MTLPELEDLAAERILVVDGAMGTQIQAQNLTAEDFGGAEYEGCNEYLALVKPDAIERIHRAYLEAGADVIETDTFGGMPHVLAEYDLAERAFDINRAAAAIARRVADELSTGKKPRIVAGSMGPGTKAISVTGGITWDELIESYYIQALGLLDGGSDVLLLETAQDTRNIKASVLGIRKAMAETGFRVPLMVSGTIELMGTMLAGQTVEALAVSLEHLPLFSIGINCATGPTFMTDHIRALSQVAKTRVTCIPNAGLPDEDGNYSESPEMMARVLERFCSEGWVNGIGGCCGTTPNHIRAFAPIAEAFKPRPVPNYHRTQISGMDILPIEEENRPYLVGERTNVLGSRKFKRLVASGKVEEAAELGRQQVRGGAHILDVCLQDPDRDEVSDMRTFLSVLVKMVKVPLMIDSTDHHVLAESLKYCQGKGIINSINLEDGEERFEKVVPLAKEFGAALVVGTIDEDPIQGMGVTVGRKLEIAQRSHQLLTEKYGIPEEDILWDALVFPVGTGDANYMHAGKWTIEGIRALKAAFPATKTILGISNVSFGLPPAGREVLNSVFLYHCTKAGLDFAIVNSEKLVRYASIPTEERELAERLLFDNSDEAIAAFSAAFRDKAETRTTKSFADLPLDERLGRYIIEGTKDGLIDDLNLKLREAIPLEIINGPLMAGMDEVGRLFNDNKLIVAEVLQSAEAMKAAVAHLEQFMERSDDANKGTVILATVKGDVHDIGKNLVDIILSNNGYKVINLGIKVPPETLIEAHRTHKPDIIGLSGLLVKSAQQMVLTAQDLTAGGISTPVLVGGAALSDKFTRTRIAPAYSDGMVIYAKDAMEGLRLANTLMDGVERRALEARLRAKDAVAVEEPVGESPVRTRRSSKVNPNADIPPPPNMRRHIVHGDVDELFDWISPQLLYGRGLGLRGNYERKLEQGDEKAVELTRLVGDLRSRVAREGWMKADAVYQFYPCASEGNTIHVYAEDRTTRLESFTFARQPIEDGLCLADYVRPIERGITDNLCLFVTTAGEGVRERSDALREKGQYLLSHALGVLAYETAEAFAEWLHSRIRGMWGFADSKEMTMLDRLQTKYRGRRYSFGYPACPEMEDQARLFRLLRPDAIGVTLTESFMMEPEASVSALVFHHPDAAYFDIR